MVKLLGVALNGGIPTCGTDRGAEKLRHSPLLQQQFQSAGLTVAWEPLVVPQDNRPQDQVADVVRQIRQHTARYARTAQPFVVLGGDHSMASGTWSGTASTCSHGLIWVDAHLDAHDFSTTLTGNMHGMPVASLLEGEFAAISPDRLAIVGVRSTEVAEWWRMERLGVRVYTMDEVTERGGVRAILPEILQRVSPQGAPFGISLDLDAIDPVDAPAVCTPVADGMDAAELLGALSMLRGDPRLLGLEIAEFTPEKDINHRTESLIAAVITTLYGAESNP